jgi:hypothetical protein
VRCRSCHRKFDRLEPAALDDLPAIQVRRGPQVVGMPCAVCGEKIVLDSEAIPCPTCARPVHTECLPHAHEANNGPYRR